MTKSECWSKATTRTMMLCVWFVWLKLITKPTKPTLDRLDNLGSVSNVSQHSSKYNGTHTLAMLGVRLLYLLECCQLGEIKKLEQQQPTKGYEVPIAIKYIYNINIILYVIWRDNNLTV